MCDFGLGAIDSPTDLRDYRLSDLVTCVLTVVPLQLLAYYVALELKYDIDKPRNLAKSVTVE